ncbi:MAG: hypothetical protein O6909_08730, partial [Alphaproteobacteria bacterium]|nr:hypothetical protein [Alphaproteobacteria bacterium]
MTLDKILTGLSALAFVAVAGGSAAADPVLLQAATIANEGFPYVDGLRKFEEVIEARPECE